MGNRTSRIGSGLSKKKLTESLKEPKVINFLEKYGYQENMTFNELLDNLKKM